MSARRPGQCDTRWCDEPAGHLGNHRAYLGEVLPDTYNMVSALSVTVEAGPAESTPRPVLAMGVKAERPWVQARLSWQQAAQLASMLTDAKHRYA